MLSVKLNSLDGNGIIQVCRVGTYAKDGQRNPEKKNIYSPFVNNAL